MVGPVLAGAVLRAVQRPGDLLLERLGAGVVGRPRGNGKRIEPPAWLAQLDAAARSTKGPCAPCVVVAHPARDYGPATKLVGAVSDWRGK